MGYQNRDKLNRLHRLLPAGLVADAAWLTRMGYPSPLRSRYVGSGWLEPVTRGVFRRPLYMPGGTGTAPLRWQHVVVSLQLVLERGIVVGGRTALELQGFGHYASSAPAGEVHLYGDDGSPGWLGKLPLAAFVFHNARRLFPDEPLGEGVGRLRAALAEGAGDIVYGSLTWRRPGEVEWPIVLSTPERAVLELLDELPERETFHQVDALMDGLGNLSPQRVDALLRGVPEREGPPPVLLVRRTGRPWMARSRRPGNRGSRSGQAVAGARRQARRQVRHHRSGGHAWRPMSAT